MCAFAFLHEYIYVVFCKDNWLDIAYIVDLYFVSFGLGWW